MSKQGKSHDQTPDASVFEVRFDKGILDEEQKAVIEKAIQDAVMEQIVHLKLPAEPRLETEMRRTDGISIAFKDF